MRHTVFLALAMTSLTVPPIAARAEPDIQAGKAVFAARCASCHYVGRNARARFGPHLNGIFGRHAGGTSDFQYSDAMRTSKLVWSRDTLDAFIRSPGKVVPGTRMRFWGIGNDKQIEDLLAYLQTFK